MAVSTRLRWLFCDLLLLTCLARCAFADTCVPVLISPTPSPEYSEWARRAGVQGTVKLQVAVGPEGGISQRVEVLHPLGWGLDEEAVKAVSQWRFRPAPCHGQRRETMMPVECSFRSLDQRGSIRFGPMVFDRSGQARQPRLTAFVPPDFYPEWEKHYTEGTVQFTVNEKGLPENFHVEHSAGEDLDKAILRALRDWRFEPAAQEGNPLLVHGTLIYSAPNHP